MGCREGESRGMRRKVEEMGRRGGGRVKEEGSELVCEKRNVCVCVYVCV